MHIHLIKQRLDHGLLLVNQELIYIVPFVAKVMESCAKSLVFKPPNPWTMAIMSVLCALHALPDLEVCSLLISIHNLLFIFILPALCYFNCVT